MFPTEMQIKLDSSLDMTVLGKYNLTLQDLCVNLYQKRRCVKRQAILAQQ